MLIIFPNQVKRVTTINIQLCFSKLSQPQQTQLIRQSLIETCITYCQMPALWFKKDNVLLSLIQISDETKEKLHTFNQHPGGKVIIGLHHGAWELTRLLPLITNNQNIAGFYKQPKSDHLEKIILKVRRALCNDMLPTTTMGVKKMYQLLHQGNTCYVMPDQSPPEPGGIFCPFMSVNTWTMTLACRYIKKLQCPVIMLYFIRLKNKTGFELQIQEVSKDIYDSDLKISVTAMNSAFAQAIGDHPQQYQWDYKRFKKQPPGQPDIYAKQHRKRDPL